MRSRTSTSPADSCAPAATVNCPGMNSRKQAGVNVVDDVRALHIYPTASAIPLSLAKTLNPKP